MPDDPHNLDRFVRAQADDYDRALAELRAGRKRSHWMWYVFPQFAGLGHSPMARHYAIASIDEARAYLAHPVLGARLRECVAALRALPPGTGADVVMGGIDAIKLRSSLTLFAEVDPGFDKDLARWFDGERDDATISRLRGRPDP